MSTRHSSYRTQRREKRAAKRRQQQVQLIAILVIILVVILFVVYTALSKPGTTAAAPTSTASTISTSMITTASGLQYEDTKVGTGAEAVSGSDVTVHYVGTLADGTKFDSSRDRNQPFEFVIGEGMVIKGWEEGVVGMKVGGIRKLVIPPSLGYGSQANGSIPANSTLYFEIELLSIK